MTWPAPRIDEGYQFYFGDPQAATDVPLPPEVAQTLARQFATAYPGVQRCDGVTKSCCRGEAFPSTKGFAFSADAIFEHPVFSRRVTDIDFSDPVHLRLGDINRITYNWPQDRCQVKRFERDHHSLNIFDRFRLTFPLFLAYRFPAAFAGSDLCWRGTMLWPRTGEHFDVVDHTGMTCRPLKPDDIGRTIYAVSIKRGERLAMHLRANESVELRRVLEDALLLFGVMAMVFLLVKIDARRLRLPAAFIGLTLLVTIVVDINFIGGLRPLDDGDDGIVYEGFARQMAHQVLAGDIVATLKGEEAVYYFAPGLRYFRAIERFAFGDTYLGYLSVMLALPFLVLALFRRFVRERWALILSLAFVATPLGVLFGSSLLNYIVWAARGFPSPLAFFFLFSGFLLIIPKPAEADEQRKLSAFTGGMLLAAATFCRPNLVMASGMMVLGAALMAFKQRHFGRIASLLGGFATLLVSPLHNYLFAHSIVPFSDNVNQPRTLLMSPLDHLKAVGELAHLNFKGPHIVGAVHQLAAWLSGPSELLVMIPVHAAAVATLIRIGLFGRRFDPWLRVVALATLLQHGIGVCYNNATRYNMGTWLLTTLVAAAWLQQEGLPVFDRRWPGLRQGWLQAMKLSGLASWIERLMGTRPPVTAASQPERNR